MLHVCVCSSTGERRRKAVCVRKSDHLVVSDQRCEYLPRPRRATENCNSDCELRYHTTAPVPYSSVEPKEKTKAHILQTLKCFYFSLILNVWFEIDLINKGDLGLVMKPDFPSVSVSTIASHLQQHNILYNLMKIFYTFEIWWQHASILS